MMLSNCSCLLSKDHFKMRAFWLGICRLRFNHLLLHCFLMLLISSTFIWSSNIVTASIPNSIPSPSPPPSPDSSVTPDFSQCNQLSPSAQISDSSLSDHSSKLNQRPSSDNNGFPKPPLISSKSLLPSSHSHELQQANNAQSKSISDFDCNQLDFCDDLPGFEAIFYLHRQLDEDDNGDIDISESDEFLRDELKYENGAERQKAFHGNDKHITVDELWRTWKISPVHNWSVDQTIDWLCNVVELPKYLEKFELNSVNGIALPRLAANPQFFSVLGINNPIHKQKIALKAMDVVLFGIPKPNTLKKDIFMGVLLAFALAVGWYAFVQHKYSQNHLKKMMKDMEALSSAEKQLEYLQVELNRTKQEHENAFREKRDLERKLKENEIQQQILAATAGQSNGDGKVVETRKASVDDTHQLIVSELQQELMLTQSEMKRLEQAYSSRQWFAPLQLQQYLQLTYEIEIKNYNAKKAAAEMQLSVAREGCDKLKKKRSTLLGAFRMAHGSSIDFVDNTILQARNLMTELTNEMQERIKRWKQIESFCCFDIIYNPGFAALEQKLYGTTIKASLASSPTSTTSTTVCGTKNLAYNRTSSSATLMEDDNLSMKSVPNYISNNTAAHGAMKQIAGSSYMNFTQQYSPMSNIGSPSDDDSGLCFANDANLPYHKRVSLENTSLTFASSSGLPVASMPVYNESSSSLFRPKTLAYSSVVPNQRKMNFGNFRRGSSDGVAKHFEELDSQSSTLTLTSQSDNSISSNFNSHNQIDGNALCNNHESNDDVASSSSSESAYALNSTSRSNNNGNNNDNGPDLKENATQATNPSPLSSSSNVPKKSKAFFGMRKRKSSKQQK